MDTPGTSPRTEAAVLPAGAGRWAGMALMSVSGLSNQTGAALGALAFPVIGPTGVVVVRQYVAAIVLLIVGRPRWRRFTWPQWWPSLLMGVAFGAMNLFLYSAIERIGLGLAVTLEFLGPLTIALVGSRRRADLACAALAAAAVAVLARPQPTTDYTGIVLGLLAGACWASYILLSRTVGRRLPGAQGSATAAALSALMFTPVGIVIAIDRPLVAGTLACATAAGLLSSAVPLLADLLALRRVPAPFFGLFMSLNPVFAAGLGLLVLGQALHWIEWAAIAAIVAANAVSMLSANLKPADRTQAVAREALDRPVLAETERIENGRCQAEANMPEPAVQLSCSLDHS